MILLQLYNGAEKPTPTLLLPMSSDDLQKGKGISARRNPMRFARALHMVAESAVAISKKQFINVRGLYYSAPLLYKSQAQSDGLIAEFCLGHSIEREAMHYRATAKGLLLGNCNVVTQMGNIVVSTLAAVPITPHFFYMQQIHTDAQFALVVEKDTIFEHITDKYEAIRDAIGQNFMLITGKGYPDVATRALVSFLDKCNMRIFGLADGDAHGMNILCLYAYGSSSTSKRVATPKAYTAPSLVPIGLFSGQIRKSDGAARGSRACDAGDLKLYDKLVARLTALGRIHWANEIRELMTLGMQYELEALLGEEGGLIPYMKEALGRQERLQLKKDAR